MQLKYEDKQKLVQFLRENASHTYLRDLSTLVKEKLNLDVTISVIKHACYDYDIQWKHKNYCNDTGITPIGSERINCGKTVVKISKGKFIDKRRYLYEKYHNVKLKRSDVILSLNGNQNDFSKENLVKVSRREMGPLARMEKTDNPMLNQLMINIAKLKVKTYDASCDKNVAN
jgi:hypothetical protein